MSQAGKGSAPRPFSVSNEEYSSRWDAIFARDTEHKTEHSAQHTKMYVQQPDALRLADELETEFPHYIPVLEAAAELRRLHAALNRALPVKTYSGGKPWHITPEE